MAMIPTDYERLVAALLAVKGWGVRASSPQRGFGLDAVCGQLGHRLGVQVKLYASERPVIAQIVMQLPEPRQRPHRPIRL